MDGSGFQVDLPAGVYRVHRHILLILNWNLLSFQSSCLSAWLIPTAPILLFVTVGLFLVLYMHHSWGVVRTVLAQSQVARHIMRSSLLILWVVFLWAMVHFFNVLESMAVAVQRMERLTLFPDIYNPQASAGYAQFGSFLAILLLVVPSLSVFFLRKATDLHNS